MSCHEVALDQLRDAGFRLTPQRAVVLDAIYHSDGHQSADQVFEHVRARLPNVDLSTIYRTLQFLRQNGLIGELRLEGEPVRHEAVRGGEEHHHAVCTGCGRLLHLEQEDLETVADLLLAKYGFHANLVHVNIPGLCAGCAREA